MLPEQRNGTIGFAIAAFIAVIVFVIVLVIPQLEGRPIETPTRTVWLDEPTQRSVYHGRITKIDSVEPFTGDLVQVTIVQKCNGHDALLIGATAPSGRNLQIGDEVYAVSLWGYVGTSRDTVFWVVSNQYANTLIGQNQRHRYCDE